MMWQRAEISRAARTGILPTPLFPQYEEYEKIAKHGKWEEIANILTTGVDVHSTLRCTHFGIVTILSATSMNGHLECVQKLVKSGAGSFKGCDDLVSYQSALEFAAIGEHMNCFHFLTEARLFTGVTVYDDIIAASKRGDFSTVLKLLSRIENKDLNGSKGVNLMNLFISHGCSPSCIHALVARGVHFFGRDSNGFTPLMYAVLSGNIECVQHLIRLKTNLMYICGADGKSAVMYAACMRNTQCLQIMLPLLSFEDILNGYNSSGSLNHLMCAAYFRNTKSLSLLLESGSSCCAHWPDNAFALAVLYKIPECIDIMLKHMKTQDIVNMTNGYVKNPAALQMIIKDYKNIDVLNQLLTHAADFGSPDSVCLLLEKGANVNCRDSCKATPLMLSCRQGSLESMKLLISHGANIEAGDKRGNRAIMYAARYNKVKCLQQLLEHNADIDVRNSRGHTALLASCMVGHDEITCILLTHVADVNAHTPGRKPAMHYAALRDHVNCVELLIDQGAEIDFRTDSGKTALITASYQGFDKVVDLLIKKGADVNAEDSNGMTAVSAAMTGDGRCMDRLLRSGKVLCNGVLKSLHKSAITKSKTKRKLTLKHILLSAEFGFFEWDYFFDSNFLHYFVFAAMHSGICPGNVNFENVEISPLLLAFMKNDLSTVGYLLANLYFFPEDYRLLSTDNATKNRIDNSHLTEGSRFLDRLTLNPLSLQAWSFLTISKAISLGGHPTGRPHRVDSLPLPEKMKRLLKFQSRISKACFHSWNKISNANFGDLLFNGSFSFPEANDNPCTDWCFSLCVGFEL